MKLKLDDKGNAVLQDGKPVYVREDGNEIPFDGAQAFGKINQLNSENQAMRQRAEAAETRVKAFEGIEDPEAARKALELASNVDQGKLVQAGKVEEVKQAALATAKAQFEGSLKATAAQAEEFKKKYEAAQQRLHEEVIGGGFERSKYIKEKIAIPPDLLRNTFSKLFSVGDDGKLVAKDSEGKPIYSKTRMGEVADFDEAIEAMVEQYPYKDQILKSSGASGSGASQSNTPGGKRIIPRSVFNGLDPAQQRQAALDQSQGKAVIQD